eukprot:6400244-Amphidinium_carterae.1
MELLKKFGYSHGTRTRTTTATPERFGTVPSVPPDQSNPEHALSTAASVLTRDLTELDQRLKHGYPKTQQREVLSPSMTTFSDASLSPSGGRSQSGFLLQLTHHEAKPHLLHWYSSKQKIIAQSSAEAEILALAVAFQTTLNFMLLTTETVPFTHPPNLRCDNQAVHAMLESPTWRSRHISMRGEAVRAAKIDGQVIVTCVATTHQLADPLTKPIGTQINQRMFPEWGL